MVEEDAGDKFSTATDASLAEDGLEVVLDGQRRKAQCPGDFPCLKALKHELGYIAFSRSEAEGGNDQRNDLRWPRLLDSDHDARGGAGGGT